MINYTNDKKKKKNVQTHFINACAHRMKHGRNASGGKGNQEIMNVQT